MAVASLTAAGCSTGGPSGSTMQPAAVQRDYERLTGTWQLTRGVVNGKPVPASVARSTILITDHNTFRFPKASGVGTHPAGTFRVNPTTNPKQVDSIAEGGPHAGQQTRGIYEILDKTTSARVGVRPAARARRGSRLFQEVDGFFNIGRKLGQCHQVKVTSRIGPMIRPCHSQLN
ncbi:MAG TPA: TIGR03067 domain-containing protein [Candidatus Udaeobacter sp.]|nr:TIGR03067 domain-containing protein [Candidatus Udaeobacter sp.]